MTITSGRMDKAGQSLENQNLKRFEIIFNNVLEAIIAFNPSFEVLNANEAACRLFGKTKDELLSFHIKHLLAMFPYRIIEKYYKTMNETDSFYYEGDITLPNGLRKYVQFVSQKHIDEAEMIVCTFRDMTTQKVLENEHLISRKMSQDIYDQAVDGIIIFDKNGCIVDVNPAICKSLRYSEDELRQMSLTDLVCPNSLYKLTKLWRSLYHTGKAAGELPIVLENGEEKYFECTTTSNIYNSYYMSIMRDITEKRQMEQRLAKSERKFREIFENAIDAIIIWDSEWKIIDANPASARTFETPLCQLIGQKLKDFINLSNKETIHTITELYHEGAIRAELPFYMPNGEVKELEFTAKRGIIEGCNLSIFRNVSERKKMEQQLRYNEQKFRKIFDGSLDGIILWDKTIILDANSAACKIAELSKEEICRHSIRSFIPKGSREQLRQHHLLLETEGEGDGEIIYHTKTEKVKVIEFSTKKDIIPGVYMTMLRDVTEKKALQEQIRKSDTMQVVGQLAAGIAHEIRNPMTALKGFIQLLQVNVKEDYSLYFDIITSELKRIEAIITDFLVLARPQAVQFKERNIVQIVKETIDLLQAQAMLTNVQFVFSFEENLPPVFCEQHQLKQVLINIIKNAIEAMANGGEITVRVKRQNEGYIAVSVRDEGEGMAEERVKRLGEPFYTTKEKGTGLGLMVSYKIIEEHKGYIDVNSKIGKGTTFTIFLPIDG